MLVCGCGPAPQVTYDDARLKLKRGQTEAAKKETDRAYQRYTSENSIWHWRFKVLKAEILARQGSNEQSLELLKAEPPSSFQTADLAVRRKLVQGVASAWAQHPLDAQRYLAESEALAKSHHPELLGDLGLARGRVGFLAGDLATAARAYEEALQAARKQNDLYIQTAALGGLAVVATKEERYDESTDWSEAALRLANSLDLQNSLAFILGNMAWNYTKLGDFDSALALYQQAGEAAARANLVPQQIYWLTGTADIYYKQHDYKAAEAVLTRGLDLARSQGDKRTLSDYLNGLAESELEIGRIETAEQYCEEAKRLEADSPDRSQLLASQLVLGRIEAERLHNDKAEEVFRGVAKDPKADTSQKWEAEARLARVYADTGRNAQADAGFRGAVAVIEAARSSIQTETLRLSFLSTAINFYGDYIDFLVSQHRADEALRLAELSRSRTLAEGLGSTTKTAAFSERDVRPEQLARRLNATLLFYWLGEHRSYLWVVTSARVTYVVLPSAQQITSVVKSYREALLSSRDPLENVNPDGQKLYELLVKPAASKIPKGSRVVVLPDGSLYGLNFETLIVPTPKPHYWIDDVTLTTASSLTLLNFAASRPVPKGKSLFLVGDTVSPNADFPALPQAAAEMQDIEKYFPQQRREVLSGGQATPAAYLSSKPEQFMYLHFVTHGTASRARPLESAVILSKEKGEDTYKLYARDIVKRHLSAYLVTISACNGAGNRTFSGEGLVGLSWAFLRAGAHNVIGALWEVSDSSTPQLMDKLYEGLSQGKDPATALREAKLSLLHSDSVFRKPYYWAPFQLYAGS